MTEDTYPPRRPRPGQSRAAPWATIIAVALLAIVGGALVAMLLGGGDPPDSSPTASRSPSPGASATASSQASPTPSAGATASASASAPADTASAAPTPTPVSLELDAIVTTTVDELSVRAGPGTGSERLGSLVSGTQAFVAEGPTDADGYRWYLLSGLGLPPNTGCAGPAETDPFNCPVWFGWVAAASPDGEPWLTPEAADCPDEPLVAEDLIIGRTNLQRLACFGADAFTFRAWWPEIPDDAGLGGACASQDEPSGWLLCQNVNDVGIVVDDTEPFGGVGLSVTIDPASSVTMPERGTWVELTVHLDDPAADGCDEAALAHGGEEPAEQYVLRCRGEMVVESVSAVDGP